MPYQTFQDQTTELFGQFEAHVGFTHTEDHIPLAITRLLPPDDAHKTPIVLVHGTYSKRNFWLSPKGIGLASHLVQQGFEVWIPELRGHGLSPKTPKFRHFDAEDHIRRDLPAVQKALTSRGQKAFWLGHSAGGLYICASLAAGWLKQDEMLGLTTLGSQITHGDAWLRFPPWAWLFWASLQLLGKLPSGLLRLGPEDEPAGEMLEYIRWKGPNGRWCTQDGRDYLPGLKDISLPTLTFGGANDVNDPPEGCKVFHDAYASNDKTFVLLSRAEGYLADYGHVEMIVSKDAQAEVWPNIAQWLTQRLPT